VFSKVFSTNFHYFLVCVLTNDCHHVPPCSTVYHLKAGSGRVAWGLSSQHPGPTWDVFGMHLLHRTLVGAGRQSKPTSSTALHLAVAHILDHNSCVCLHQLLSRVQLASTETLLRGLIKGWHCTRGQILPTRRWLLRAAAYPMTLPTLRMKHDARSRQETISDIFCLVCSSATRMNAFMCLLRLCQCDTPPSSRAEGWPHNLHDTSSNGGRGV